MNIFTEDMLDKIQNLLEEGIEKKTMDGSIQSRADGAFVDFADTSEGMAIVVGSYPEGGKDQKCCVITVCDCSPDGVVSYQQHTREQKEKAT